MRLSNEQKYLLEKAFNRLVEEPETLRKFIRQIDEGGLDQALPIVDLDPELVAVFQAYLRELNPGIDPRPGQWYFHPVMPGEVETEL